MMRLTTKLYRDSKIELGKRYLCKDCSYFKYVRIFSVMSPGESETYTGIVRPCFMGLAYYTDELEEFLTNSGEIELNDPGVYLYFDELGNNTKNEKYDLVERVEFKLEGELEVGKKYIRRDSSEEWDEIKYVEIIHIDNRLTPPCIGLQVWRTSNKIEERRFFKNGKIDTTNSESREDLIAIYE